MRVNVGSGPDAAPGWVNIDSSPSVLLSPYPRMRKTLRALGVLTPQQATGFPREIRRGRAERLPFADKSVDCVYSGHVIEHLPRWKAEAFLSECFRVLKPGGIVRVVTPDLRALAARYLDGHHDGQPTPADWFCTTYGAYRDTEGPAIRRLIRRTLSGADHQWLYDAELLRLLLAEAGFTSIEQRGYHDSAIPDLFGVEHRPDSLFMEARH